jgi:hypothetical protein
MTVLFLHTMPQVAPKNFLNMLPNIAILGTCVQLSKVITLKGTTQI